MSILNHLNVSFLHVAIVTGGESIIVYRTPLKAAKATMLPVNVEFHDHATATPYYKRRPVSKQLEFRK